MSYVITGCKHCDGWHREEPCPSVPVGTEVSWKGYGARVRSVQGDGAVIVEWTGRLPHPFFTGPYHVNELEIR